MRRPKLLGIVSSMGPSVCSPKALHCIVNNLSICSPVLTSSSVHATISPSLLIPASQDSQYVHSKMVDFAIVLRPNEKLASPLPLTGECIEGGVRSSQTQAEIARSSFLLTSLDQTSPFESISDIHGLSASNVASPEIHVATEF